MNTQYKEVNDIKNIKGREEGSLCFFLVGFQLLLFNAFVLLFLSSVFRL